MQINAIILAGGKSKRMGTDKAIIPFKGSTLLEYSVKLWQPLFKSIIISSNNPAHKIQDCTIIPDKIPDCGPIGGIYSCLEASDTDWNFVISVDSPFVSRELVSLLISEIGDYNAVIPVHPNGKEPLIGLYHKNAAVQLKTQIKEGNFKMLFLLEKLNVNFVDAQSQVDENPLLFKNLNRPEDLKTSKKN